MLGAILKPTGDSQTLSHGPSKTINYTENHWSRLVKIKMKTSNLVNGTESVPEKSENIN